MRAWSSTRWPAWWSGRRRTREWAHGRRSGYPPTGADRHRGGDDRGDGATAQFRSAGTIWFRRVLGRQAAQRQRHSARDVSQASGCAAARRSAAAGAVPGARLIDVRAIQLRSHGARPRRILVDECVCRLRLRCLDDGSRRLWQIRAHRRQFRHRQRGGGPEGGGGCRCARNRADAIPFPGRIVRRAARGGIRRGRARSRRPPDAGRLHLHRQGLAHARQARRAGRVFPHAQHAAARPRDDREHLHSRQAGHHRSRGAKSAGGRGTGVRRSSPDRDLSRHDRASAGDRSDEGSRRRSHCCAASSTASQRWRTCGTSFGSCRMATSSSRSSPARRMHWDQPATVRRSGMWRRHS